MTKAEEPRLLMEAIAELHARGYGLLKLRSYVKEGLGAWRCWVFASHGEFPDSIRDWPGPLLHRSFPGPLELSGTTPAEVADSVLAEYPDLAQAGRGEDDSYTAWYAAQLAAHPGALLIMESSSEAQMSGHRISELPPLKSWHRPGTPEEHARQWAAAREAANQLATERAIARGRRRHSKR